MAKWEYLSVSLMNTARSVGLETDQALLNKYGEDGWELVSVVIVPVRDDLQAYLKRPKI